MKVVLIKEIPGLGIVGDTKEVKDGYARNFLVPQGLVARIGDPKAKQIVEHVLQERKKAQKALDNLQKAAEKLSEKVIVIETKVGSSGKLFGAVTAEDVAKKISSDSHQFLAKNIEMKPIKELGEHEIYVKLGGQIKSLLKLKIIAKKNKK